MNPSRHPDVLALPILLGALCSSCAYHDVSLHDEPAPTATTEVFGFSVEGRPIRGHIFGDGDETVVLLGVIHGNEPAGEPLLDGFVEHLAADPSVVAGRRIVVLPVTNPDGLARRTRRNARDVDLNRNFPSRNWARGRYNGSGPASEPETKAILRVIRQFRPVRILAVHAPLRMVNFDGPARVLAERMAEGCGYPVEGYVGYPTPGSLGSWAGKDWSIPTITLELGKDIRGPSAWTRFRRSIEAFVTFDASDEPAPMIGDAVDETREADVGARERYAR